MRIAISSTGRNLDGPIDPRFGRCAHFLIVNTDDMSFEAFDNESIALGGGAGIQAAQFVASKGAKVVITGNCGPNAVRTLSAAGIKVIVGQQGRIGDVIEAYKEGDLRSTNEPNVSDHYGMTRGFGGRGGGMGRGMRCGGGMGRGMSQASSLSAGESGQSTPKTLSPEEELLYLKQRAENMREQIKDVESRIRTLEGK